MRVPNPFLVKPELLPLMTPPTVMALPLVSKLAITPEAMLTARLPRFTLPAAWRVAAPVKLSAPLPRLPSEAMLRMPSAR